MYKNHVRNNNNNIYTTANIFINLVQDWNITGTINSTFP